MPSASQATKPFVYLPKQTSAPIPAASTTGAACIYTDGVNLLVSVNGGAYVSFAGTLQAAYDGGGAGAGRTILANSNAVVINKSSVDANNALEVNVTGGTGLAAVFTGASISCPGLGASSERFGTGAIATAVTSVAFGASAGATGGSAGGNRTAIGYLAASNGLGSIAIGASSDTGVGAGTRNIVIGTLTASSGGTDTVIVGSGALSGAWGDSQCVLIGGNVGNGVAPWTGAAFNLSGANNVVIGYQAQCGVGGCVVIGQGAFASVTAGGQKIAIGQEAYCLQPLSVAIGYRANTQGAFNAGIAIGNQASAQQDSSIAIGSTATVTTANTCVIGSSASPINNVYFGKGATDAAPTTYTINGTGGTGAGVAGAALNLAGGISGDAATAGGAINFQVALAGTGTTLTTVFSVTNTGALSAVFKSTTGTLYSMAFTGAVTLTAAVTGLLVDLSTNVASNAFANIALDVTTLAADRMTSAPLRLNGVRIFVNAGKPIDANGSNGDVYLDSAAVGSQYRATWYQRQGGSWKPC